MAPIHKAAREGNVAALRRILAGGVSPDVLDDNPGERWSPLLHLLEHHDRDDSDTSDRVACFKLLRDAGANLEARTGGHPQGSTVVHYAADSGSPGILSLLIEAGVNVNVANDGGYTPLHWAARGDFCRALESVELLLKAGAAVNVRSETGSTPFAVALRRGDNRRMWPLFLSAGAEIPVPRPLPSRGHPYLSRVHRAGGFKKYEQAHLARITAILETPLLPPELVRKILEFWLHAGYY